MREDANRESRMAAATAKVGWQQQQQQQHSQQQQQQQQSQHQEGDRQQQQQLQHQSHQKEQQQPQQPKQQPAPRTHHEQQVRSTPAMGPGGGVTLEEAVAVAAAKGEPEAQLLIDKRQLHFHDAMHDLHVADNGNGLSDEDLSGRGVMTPPQESLHAVASNNSLRASYLSSHHITLESTCDFALSSNSNSKSKSSKESTSPRDAVRGQCPLCPWRSLALNCMNADRVIVQVVYTL